MTNNWSVFVLEYAYSHEPWVGLVKGMEKDGMVDLPYSFVLATKGDRRILVDAGFMKTGSEEEFPRKFQVKQWISPLRMLAEMDVRPEDITDIVVTHAHFDHMGAIGEFPDAHIHIQKTELLTWYEAIALPRRFSHLTRIIDPDTLRAALNASIQHRVTLIDGDRDHILPGIHVRLAAGHTAGQQIVIIDTEKGAHVISGDCIYTRRQLTGHDNNGVYVPLNNATGTVWDQLKSIDRLNDAIDGDQSRLVILHDVDRWKGRPVVAEVEGYRVVQIV
ncbi:N-acyl homoserine lactonase family protein [Aliiruegeria lutimaris]|uniref:Metallo-beta-lactamase superfamily protein n=1 Tax=Aliiruegeria lutimaris TaxID=571298 RepID=A0A1G9AHQ8_9RHOB|nr:N-acyl homoserine lactonase family protein [Aliiruegeria lutimaris]SDK26100.1 Metallo-beta-lactamase superfamily protein [Aliiruegeria lutimaris]